MALYKHLKSSLKLLIKLLVTAFCLVYVIRKIDWQQSWEVVRQSNVSWLFAALLLIVLSKLVAAFRLNIYFRNIEIRLSEKINLQLYWLGMFYNVFLPGGIGGDAYKVILLNQTHKKPAKLLTAAVFLDRVSGVAGIGILSAGYYFAVFNGSNYPALILLLLLPGLGIYFLIVKRFFPSFIKSFWPTLWLGILVQGLQVIAVYCLMAALHLDEHYSIYMLIFLISSIIAVLPFTIGGLGAREMVFLYGSKYFLLNQNESVCISLLFYLISVAISLTGIYWVYSPTLKIAIKNQDETKTAELEDEQQEIRIQEDEKEI